MTQWIWEHDNWTDFQYDENRLRRALTRFDFNNQISLRDNIMFDNAESDDFVVTIQGLEAIKTSEIEGEVYQLPQIINSIRSGFNILANTGAEENSETRQKRRKSISDMMVSLYRNFDQPLTEDLLNSWNSMLTHKDNGENSYSGVYRPYEETMEIGNGAPGTPPCYIAPPMASVKPEMDKFIQWFNDTSPKGNNPMHPVIRAGLAHLYFVAIHPYDDGNGRIARALAVKCVSETNGEPTLVSLSHAISDSSKEYYAALEKATKDGDINAWLEYFSETVVKGQEITKRKLCNAAIAKTIFTEHASDLNESQKNTITSMLEGKDTKKEGILSVAEYIQQNKTDIQQRAKTENKPFKTIAKDDIDELVKLKIVRRSKEIEAERYVLIYPRSQGIEELRPNRNSGLDRLRQTLTN